MSYGQVNADVIGTSVAGSNIGAGNASILKNRIINGSMVIDQRNAGASVTLTSNTYMLDRYQFVQSTTGKLTVQQNAGSVTPPVGFSNYMGITSTSAYSVGTTEYFYFQQPIEGYNVADLNWGTANAKTVTLSFQVYSSLTGTFGGALQNSAQDRSYPFSYTISSANTWTTISVTIAGDTSGTWLKTNGAGIYVIFGLGVGLTSLNGTAGAWVASDKRSVTGATSVVGTSGATFYITGVQLEVGRSATGFEYVNYQTSLANCQRYCQIVLGVANQQSPWVFSASATTDVTGNYQYVVSMRTSPSLTVIGSSIQLIEAANNTFTSGTIGLDNTNYNSTRIYSTSTSGLTQFRTYWMRSTNANSYYLFTYIQRFFNPL